MKKIFLIIFICPFFLTYGCKDEDKDSGEWISAIVVDLGDPAVDGCGWAIIVDDVVSIPNSLADQYKKDGLEISIKCENTSQVYTCPGFSNLTYPMITIKKIK